MIPIALACFAGCGFTAAVEWGRQERRRRRTRARIADVRARVGKHPSPIVEAAREH